MTLIVHALVREALAELADPAYQRRIWTASEGPEIGSLTEAIARLFDDSGLGDALARGHEIYGTAADPMLRELDALLAEVDDGRAPASILRDPRIDEIRRLAAALLRELDLGHHGSSG